MDGEWGRLARQHGHWFMMLPAIGVLVAASEHNRPVTIVCLVLMGVLALSWRVWAESSGSPRWEGVSGWAKALYGCCFALVTMGAVTIGGQRPVGTVGLLVGSGLVLLGLALSVVVKRSLRS